MPGEYNASIVTFVSTVVVDNWKGSGRTARMNTADYVAERDGEIVEGPTIRPNTPGNPVLPNKDPRIDADGNCIADLPSRMLRA